MFRGKRGAQLAKEIARRSKTFNQDAGLPTNKKKGDPLPGDVEAVKNALSHEPTVDEAERWESFLHWGQAPGRQCRSVPTDDGEEGRGEDTVTNRSRAVWPEYPWDV